MVVLTVLDDSRVTLFLARLLEDWGHTVVRASSAREVAGMLRRQAIDLILANNALAHADPSLPSFVQRYCPHTPVIAVGDGHDGDRRGDRAVWHYLPEPVDPARLRELVRLAERHKRACDENRLLREELAQARAAQAITGLTSSAERLREAVWCAAQSRANVLIRGEPGTGKRLLARAIHAAGPCAGGPFVVSHCDGLPPAEQAHSGTLFVDEVGDASPDCQQALLEMLSQRDRGRYDLQHPGDGFRLIASTSRCLETAVGSGRFSEELLLRLNVLSIHVPALRERPEDLLSLADGLLRRHSARHNRPRPRLSAGAAAALLSHPWPGNLRELSSVIERLVLLGDRGTIRAQDVCRVGAIDAPGESLAHPQAGGEGSDVVVLDAAAWPTLTLEQFGERVLSRLQEMYVRAMLRAEGGCVKHAAERGRIAPRTFRRMLRRHNITPAQFRDSRPAR